MVPRAWNLVIGTGLLSAWIGCNRVSTGPEPRPAGAPEGWYRVQEPESQSDRPERFHVYEGYFRDGIHIRLQLGYKASTPADSLLIEATCRKGVWKAAKGVLSIDSVRTGTMRRVQGLLPDWQRSLVFQDPVAQPGAVPFRLAGDTLRMGPDSAGDIRVLYKDEPPASAGFHPMGYLSIRIPAPAPCWPGDTVRLAAYVEGNLSGAEYAWRLPGQSSFIRAEAAGIPWIAPAEAGTYTAWFRVKDGYGQIDSVPVAIRVKPAPIRIPEDSTLVLDLDRVFDGERNALPHVYALLSVPGRVATILEGSALTLVPERDYFGKAGLAIESARADGSVLVDTLWVEYLPVNDPPRLVSSVSDTAIPYFDTLVYDLNACFRDPELQPIRFELWADSKPMGPVPGGRLVLGGAKLGMAGLAPGAVTIRIVPSDGDSAGEPLVFSADLNLPMRTGKTYPMPVYLVESQSVNPMVFMETTGRKLVLLASHRPLILDEEGRAHASLALQGELDLKWGFRDSTVFSYQASATVADSMRWVTITDRGPVYRAFGFEAGGTQWGADVAYIPVAPSGASGFLFIRKSRMDPYGERNAFFLERWSPGGLSPLRDLGLPEGAGDPEIRVFGSGFVCIWSTRIDTLLSSAQWARYFSSEGTPLSEILPLTTYAPGSQPGYGRNLTSMAEALVFNGNLEIFTTSANILVKTTAQQTIGDIDHAAFRTVITPGFTVLSRQAIAEDAYLGAYATMFGMNWNPLDGVRYRLNWTSIGYSGMNIAIAGITVDTEGNNFSDGSDMKTETGWVDFRFSGGNVLRFSNGYPFGSAMLMR